MAKTSKPKDTRPKPLRGVRNPDLYPQEPDPIQGARQMGARIAYEDYKHRTGNIGWDTFSAEGLQEQHYDPSNPLYKVGQSTWDNNFMVNATPEDVQDARAHNQAWWSQWGAGALKMLGTAATTTVDGTLGTLCGFVQGLQNVMDDDENTGFLDGLWNNKVTNAMAEVSEAMEEALPNYQSQWEQNATWYQRMFSGEGGANFWANDILKNAGFTMGAALSIYLTGGLGGAIGKGLSGLGKMAKLTNAAGDLTKAGKFAKWTANTLASTIGEASTEALNTYRDNAKLMDMNSAQRVNGLKAKAYSEYQQSIAEGIDPSYAKAAYDAKITNIEENEAAYKKTQEGKLIDASNAVLGANVAVLALSNNLTLGNMIRGGYGNAKTLLQRAVKTVDGKPVTEASDIAKGMLKGNLKFESKEIENGAAKAAGKYLLSTTQEGLEEGAQNLASSTAQINVQANMNKWARTHSTLGSQINPDAEEEVASFASSLGKALEENFGTANSGGWTEVAAGFISGALGIGSLHRNKAGKIRPTWQGGFKEAYDEVYGEKKATDEAIAMMNDALTSGKFGERVKHATANMAIRSKMLEALNLGDIEGFKNAEMEAIVTDALYARDLGLLDGYLAMFDELQKPMSEETLNEVKGLATNKDTGVSALENSTDDEIKETYQQKAAKSKERAEAALKEYDRVTEQHGDKFSDATRREAMLELTYKNSLLADTFRRQKELGDEVQELENKEKLTPTEETELKEKKKAIEKLDKQANDLNKEIKDIEQHPEKLEKEILKMQDMAHKARLYRQAENAIAKYKEANTLADIKEVYNLSPEENKEEVLNQAIAQAEGETKVKLQQFKDFIGDTQLLDNQIDKMFPEDEEMQKFYRGILNNIVEDMLHDESAPLTRENVKEKLLKAIDEMKERQEERRVESGGLTLTEDGQHIDIKKAIDEELIEEGDFENYLDEEDNQVKSKPTEQWENKKMAAADVVEWQKHIDNVNKLMAKVDLLDELRKAAPKPDPAKSKRKTNTPSSKPVNKPTNRPQPQGGGKGKGKKSIMGGDTDTGKITLADLGLDNSGEDASNNEGGVNRQVLTPEEQTAFTFTTVKGDSGVVYNVFENVDEAAAAKIDAQAVLDKMNTLRERIEMIKSLLENPENTAAKLKDELHKLVEMIEDTLIVDEDMKACEEIFKKTLAARKPKTVEKSITIEEQNAADEAKELKDTDTSLIGTANTEYDKDELKDNKHLKKKEKSGWLLDWLEKQGIHPQKNLDALSVYLHKANKGKKMKERTPVYYLHHSDRPSDIMLAIKVSECEDVTTVPSIYKPVTIDGEQYIIIGNLGYDEKFQPTTKAMFETLSSEIKAEHPVGKDWHIFSKHNYFKDTTAGYIVTSTEYSSKEDLTSVNELYEDVYDSPSEIKWVVIEGTEAEPVPKTINVDEDKETAYRIKGGRPGQVYVYGQDSKGRYIPIYVETLFYNEAMDNMNVTSDLYKSIDNAIKTLANPEASHDDKLKALLTLKDSFIFSNTNQIHLNDENYRDPNTLYATINGVARKLIDYKEGTSAEANEEALRIALKELNPRLQISTTALERNPEKLLEAGVIRTNAEFLYTKGTQLYVYPVDNEGTATENQFKAYKNAPTSKGNKFSKEYINGKYYFYDGVDFYNNKGEKLDPNDEKTKAERELVELGFKVKAGIAKRITTKNAIYYKVDSHMYVNNGHGGLTYLNKEEQAKAEKMIDNERKAKEKQKQIEELTKARKEKAAEKEKENLIVAKEPVFTKSTKEGITTYTVKGRATNQTSRNGNTKYAAYTISKDIVQEDELDNLTDATSISVREIREDSHGHVAAEVVITEKEGNKWEGTLKLKSNPLKEKTETPSTPKEETEDDKIILPSFADTMKGQLGDKKSSWDTYVNDTTRKDKDGLVYTTGMYFQSVISPALSFMQEAGMLPNPKEYYLTDNKLYLDEWSELSDLLKEYQIDTPADLIPWVEKHAGMSREDVKDHKETLEDNPTANAEDKAETPPDADTESGPETGHISLADLKKGKKPAEKAVENSEEKSNFVNGDEIEKLKSKEDLEESKNNGTFVARILADENTSKADEIYEAASAIGIDEDSSAEELMQELQKLGIDTSQDLDTILTMIKCKS